MHAHWIELRSMRLWSTLFHGHSFQQPASASRQRSYDKMQTILAQKDFNHFFLNCDTFDSFQSMRDMGHEGYPAECRMVTENIEKKHAVVWLMFIDDTKSIDTVSLECHNWKSCTCEHFSIFLSF